jgi:hypothetical protein
VTLWLIAGTVAGRVWPVGSQRTESRGGAESWEGARPGEGWAGVPGRAGKDLTLVARGRSRGSRSTEGMVSAGSWGPLTDGEATGLFLGHSAALQQQGSERLRETWP